MDRGHPLPEGWSGGRRKPEPPKAVPRNRAEYPDWLPGVSPRLDQEGAHTSLSVGICYDVRLTTRRPLALALGHGGTN